MPGVVPALAEQLPGQLVVLQQEGRPAVVDTDPRLARPGAVGQQGKGTLVAAARLSEITLLPADAAGVTPDGGQLHPHARGLGQLFQSLQRLVRVILRLVILPPQAEAAAPQPLEAGIGGGVSAPAQQPGSGGGVALGQLRFLPEDGAAGQQIARLHHGGGVPLVGGSAQPPQQADGPLRLPLEQKDAPLDQLQLVLQAVHCLTALLLPQLGQPGTALLRLLQQLPGTALRGLLLAGQREGLKTVGALQLKGTHLVNQGLEGLLGQGEVPGQAAAGAAVRRLLFLQQLGSPAVQPPPLLYGDAVVYQLADALVAEAINGIASLPVLLQDATAQQGVQPLSQLAVVPVHQLQQQPGVHLPLEQRHQLRQLYGPLRQAGQPLHQHIAHGAQDSLHIAAPAVGADQLAEQIEVSPGLPVELGGQLLGRLLPQLAGEHDLGLVQGQGVQPLAAEQAVALQLVQAAQNALRGVVSAGEHGHQAAPLQPAQHRVGQPQTVLADPLEILDDQQGAAAAGDHREQQQDRVLQALVMPAQGLLRPVGGLLPLLPENGEALSQLGPQIYRQDDPLILHELPQLHHDAIPQGQRVGSPAGQTVAVDGQQLRPVGGAQKMADQLALAGAALPHQQLGTASGLSGSEGVGCRSQPGIGVLPADGNVVLFLPVLGAVIPLVHNAVVQHGGIFHGGGAQILGQLLLQPLVHLGCLVVLAHLLIACHQEHGGLLVIGVLPQILLGLTHGLLQVAPCLGRFSQVGQAAQILLVQLLPGAYQPLLKAQGVLDAEALKEGTAVGGEVSLAHKAVVVAVQLPLAVHRDQ